MINYIKGCREKIIAVVVTYNRPIELSKVVNSLLNQSCPPDHILIVDNASTPPASAYFTNSKNITVLRSEVNTGGAGGFALGLDWTQSADADWAWLMDDDAAPQLDALAVLRQQIKQSPLHVGAICSAVYEFANLSYVHRRTFNKYFGFEKAIPETSYHHSSCEIDTGSFVGFLVRMEAVKKIGLPDEKFFIAYDDTEYSLRLKSNGWTLRLAPSSKIDHLITVHSQLKTTSFNYKHYYNVRNRLVVLRRYTKFKTIAGFYASFYGLAIWLRSRSPFTFNATKILARAIKDGWRERLGKVT